MSRKVKQSKPHAKPAPHAMDSAALAADAAAALSASRFKEATELFKELVKRERQTAWVDGLAESYAGRAQELAAKGMVKEALMLWRNRAQLCGKPLAQGDYLVWLLRAGERGEMLQFLSDKSLPDAMRLNLEMHLAASILAEPNATPSGLSPDSALLRHLPGARAALEAYCKGDFVALETHLQAIPFRSPYRDLKTVLKALSLLQTDVEGARAAITRLAAGGAFERLAAVVRAAVLPEDGWLAALRDLDENGRQMLLDIKGCPNALRPFLLELAKLGAAPAPAQLFDLLTRFRRVIPEEALSALCLRLFPQMGRSIERLPDFKKLPKETQLHMMALAAEAQGVLGSAEEYWKDLANLLSKIPDQKLRAALVLRHLADIALDNKMDTELNAEAFRYVEKSLELDPDDRSSYLAIIRTLRCENELAKARAFLDRALPRFPKDAGVLLEAVEVALAGKAFKKAVGFAKQVLELDPINPKVRGLIGQALFSHARKQIKARNLAAARKELDASEEWLRSPVEWATLKLLRVFLTEYLDETLLRAAVADLGGSLVGAFRLLLEAGKVGHDPRSLLLSSGCNLTAPPPAEAVVALAQVLNAAPDGAKALGAALGPLRATLKRALKMPFSEADYLLVCEALHRCEDHELLTAFTKEALKRWPGRPVFVYLNVIARHGSDIYFIPYKDQDALDRAAREAHKQGDHRTSSRIRTLLSPPEEDMDDDSFDPFDLPFPEEGSFGSAMEGFLGELSEAKGESLGGALEEFLNDPRKMFEMLVAMQGEKAFLEIMRKEFGKQEFDELKRQCGGNQKDLIRMLVDAMVEGAEMEMPAPVNRPGPRKPKSPAPKNQKDLF